MCLKTAFLSVLTPVFRDGNVSNEVLCAPIAPLLQCDNGKATHPGPDTGVLCGESVLHEGFLFYKQGYTSTSMAFSKT